MLVSKVPKSLLSAEDGQGRTPLYLAAKEGDERTVPLLLSAGVRQRRYEHGRRCPLSVSIKESHEGVVRLLMTKGGMEALGDSSTVLSRAVFCAARMGRRSILRLVLTADGEDKEIVLAQQFDGVASVLHHAVACGQLGSVRILLAAGAGEAAREFQGDLPREAIVDALEKRLKGAKPGNNYINEFIAIHRELAQGLAFRARSWAWPVQRVINPDTGHDGAVVKLVATLAARQASVFGVRILRRRRSTSFFVELVGRHAHKV